MEFDKTRVYTAVNADELPIGSRCIFADTVEELKRKVLNVEAFINTLERVCNENEDARFVCNGGKYLLAYFIDPPKESGYKPFSSMEKVMEAIKKHGEWVKEKATGDLKLINSINGAYRLYSIGTGGAYCTPEAFLECYIFDNDNSHCGELAEE